MHNKRQRKKLEDRMHEMELSMKRWTVKYFDTMKGLESQNQELKNHVDANLLCIEGLVQRVEVLESAAFREKDGDCQ